MRHRFVCLIMAIAAAFVLATPVLAGAVIVVLDSSPTNVQAGVPFSVNFTVISHGDAEALEPIAGLTPVVSATSASGQSVTATAHPEGAPGHYAVTLNLPSVEEWQWGIAPFGSQGFQTTMTPIQVHAAAPDSGWRLPEPLVLRWAGVVLLLLAAGLAFLSQRRTWGHWRPRQAH